MINVPLFNQWDQRWRFEKLGKTGRTLGSDGCAMTCLGMFQGLNPIETLNRMNGVGGVMDSGDLLWTKVHEAFPSVRFHFRWGTVIEDRYSALRKQVAVAYADICILLALGQPVLVRTTNPSGLFHWVLAKEILPGDLLVNDPDGGKEIAYSSRFGNPSETILAYAILIKQPDGLADNVSESLKRDILLSTAIALPKAAAIRAGESVDVYSKELLDTFL